MKKILKMLLASFFVWFGMSNQVQAQEGSRLIFIDSMKPLVEQSMEGLILELSSSDGESVIFKSENQDYDFPIDERRIYELNQINTIAGYRQLQNIEIDFSSDAKVIIVEANEIVLVCDYYPGSRIDVYDEEGLVDRLETRDGYYYFKGGEVDKEYRFVFVYGNYAKEFYSSLKKEDNGYKKVDFSVEADNDLPVTFHFKMEIDDPKLIQETDFELFLGDELISREKCSISGNTFYLKKGVAYTIKFNNRIGNFIARRSNYDFILDSVSLSAATPEIGEPPLQQVTQPKSVKDRKGDDSNVIVDDLVTSDHNNSDDNPIVMTGDDFGKVVIAIASFLAMITAIGGLGKKSRRRGENANKIS